MPAQTSSINQPQVNLQNTTSKDIKTSSNNQLNANSGGAKTPLEQPEYIKQAQMLIEKKVRNLEKRKIKLEEYQDMQKKGQTLNEDQLLAVSKYGEVKVSIEMAKELDNQLVTLANETMKALKKQAKKEQQDREEQLKEKVKEIRKIESVLNTFGDESIRNDFLEGRNGANQLTKQELELLDDFHKLACSTEFSKTIENDVNDSADHLLSLIESKNKSVLTTTYSDLKKIFDRVMTSSYWTNEKEQEKVPEKVEEPQQQQVLEETEQKNVNYQQNTSSEDYVIVTSQEVENTQLEQQQLAQDQKTFFSTLNTQETVTQFLSESNDGINFLQDSQIPTQYDQQDQHQSQDHHHQQQYVSNNNQQQGDYSGGNQYGFNKQRHYNNNNDNYIPRNNGNGGGYRRPYNPSDNNDRRGGSRGGYQGGRGGPQGGRGRGGYRGGSGGYKPRGGAPSGNNYRQQQPVEGQ
jgi:caprin-1